MIPALDPDRPLAAELREAVATRIAGFLDTQVEVTAPIGPEFAPVIDLARRLTAGGKRLRPAFAIWGHVAAAGLDATPALDAVVTAAASLDLLHVSALVHDDVMDASDLRRGMPAAHKQFEDVHARIAGAGGGVGGREQFGRAGAILLGDLLLMWSAELARTAGLVAAGIPTDRVGAGMRLLEAMRTEVTCGQYLDVLAQARPLTDGGTGEPDTAAALDEAARVVEFKAARYTVQRPAQFGAVLGGAGPDTIEALGAFGSALGRAFQYRDDVLGVFGDEQVTGKPAGDDLREGKRTVLIAHTWAGLSAKQRTAFAAGFGRADLDPDGVARLRELITTSGARRRVEDVITEHARLAREALSGASVTEPGRTALAALVTAAVDRAA